MKVTIFEVCRSPEIKKITEPVVLSEFFAANGIDYEVYSNDGIWPHPVTISKNFIEACLKQSEPEIIHLAMHGDDYSFILKWSRAEQIKSRVPEAILTGPEIQRMREWREKLIVSGACNSSKLAPFFLEAGARAVIAPEFPVSWANLGQFFCVFYEALFSGEKIEEALKLALSRFPEYWCYQIHRKQAL
jgi:hypothetical protein